MRLVVAVIEHEVFFIEELVEGLVVAAVLNHLEALLAALLGDLHRGNLLLGQPREAPDFVQGVAAEVVVDIVGEGLVQLTRKSQA